MSDVRMLTLTLSEAECWLIHKVLHDAAIRRGLEGDHDGAAKALGCWYDVDLQMHAWEVGDGCPR